MVRQITKTRKKPRKPSSNGKTDNGKKPNPPIRDERNSPQRSVSRNMADKEAKKHPAYGTSKLEDDFARDILDPLGVIYIRQFEAKDIGRFYDFYLPEDNLIIEVDGSYYHAEGLALEEMNAMQKKNRRVDELKDKWALLHSIPIMRIWESDIRKHPNKVREMVKERVKTSKDETKELRTKRRNKVVKKKTDDKPKPSTDKSKSKTNKKKP